VTSFVGAALVHNEDVYIERAIRNAAAFCDRIHAVDHMSTDGTWKILQRLAVELDHLEVRRSVDAYDAHRQLEGYAGTRTWVLRIDGDHLFDPEGLAQLRESLLAGEHADSFRIRAHTLHCDELNEQAGMAWGWLAPPSRTGVQVYNLDAVAAWSGCPEPLIGGQPAFRPGYDWQRMLDLTESTDWETDPLRLLHVCFLRRSSVDAADYGAGRLNLNEQGAYRRGLAGRLKRLVRAPRIDPRVAALHRQGSNWKLDKYRRGPRISVDATPFLGQAVRR
jgi:glycosyl transferase family 2